MALFLPPPIRLALHGSRRPSPCAAAAATASSSDPLFPPLLPPLAGPTFMFLTTSEMGTKWLARELALNLTKGDIICLFGNVGAGKSAFCRGVIRAVADDPYLPVPSPTFLLLNHYDALDLNSSVSISHYDLYRLRGPDDPSLARLALERCAEDGAALIEWSERLAPNSSCPAGALPEDRLEVHMAMWRVGPGEAERWQAVEGRRVVRWAGQEDGDEEEGNSAEAEEEEESSETRDLSLRTDSSWRVVQLRPSSARWCRIMDRLSKRLESGMDLKQAQVMLIPTNLDT